MEPSSAGSKTPRINVREVLRAKNRNLAKVIPSFIINYIENIIHQEELNGFLQRSGHLRDKEFIEASLEFLFTEYTAYGHENIPSEGRFIFVSNHPLGGLDGLVFMNEVSKYFDNVRFPVNDILLSLENMSGIFLPVNKHGFQGRSAAQRIEESYASDDQILYFPAGLCSRKQGGEIRDLTWHKSFITKAIQYKRDIIPAFFSGRNSNFFYNLSNLRTFFGIKANIEMLYLPDEMLRQRGKEIKLVFGKSIPWQTFDRSKSPAEWAQWVKSITYDLKSNLKAD